jgi:hypothetical protein
VILWVCLTPSLVAAAWVILPTGAEHIADRLVSWGIRLVVLTVAVAYCAGVLIGYATGGAGDA